MATLTFDAITALEMAKRLDPTRQRWLPIVEQLTLMEMMFKTIPFVQADDFTLHKINRRNSVPQGSWVADDEGSAYVATTTEAVEERMGKLVAFSKEDADKVDRAPDPSGLRWGEAKGIIQGMGNNIMSTFLYGNRASDIHKFTGLAPRLATANAKTIIDGGGTGSDVTSIYAYVPGTDKTHLIYPRTVGGQDTMGITREDLGKRIINDSNSNPYTAYGEKFKVEMGLAVHDLRCIGRYANIESSGASNIFDEDKLIELLAWMKDLGEAVILAMNRTVLIQVKKAIKDKGNVYLSYEDAFGKKGIPFLMGHPVVISDSIVDTESAIS
jgi:hypothetical protein